MLRLFLLFALALFLCGCPNGQQTQARAADAIARVANGMLPPLVERYRAEGDRAIEQAATVEEARASLQAVRAAWKPVWDAWGIFAAAHDSYAAALESGAVPNDVALRAAYCDLRAVLGDRAELPNHPVLPCEVSP